MYTTDVTPSLAMITDAPEPEMAAPLRLMLDMQAERTNAHLRIAAAWIALGAGIWLGAVENDVWLRLTALVSIAFALRWLTAQRAARARLLDGQAYYVEISPERLVIAEGPSQRSVARDEIRAIELDEDRLIVVVRLVDGEELAIEPRYGNLGPRELGHTLHRVLFGSGSE